MSAPIVAVISSTLSSPRCYAEKIGAGKEASIGPYQVDLWVQVTGVIDSRLEAVIAPPKGTSPGVSPDRWHLPPNFTPFMLPIGAILTLANVGAGDRAVTISHWTV